MSNESFNEECKVFYKLTDNNLIPFVPTCIRYFKLLTVLYILDENGDEVSNGILGVDAFDSIEATILDIEKRKAKKLNEINKLSKILDQALLLKEKGGVQ